MGLLDSLLRLFRPGGGFSFAAKSERGLVRKENQDSFFASGSPRVLCVADGMGGGQGGAKASEIVCRAVAGAAKGGPNAIDAAIRAANGEIRAFAASAGYRQMATTVAVLAFAADGRGASAGHVGDSRIYRLRQGRLERLTDDHTVAAEIGRRAGGETGRRLSGPANPLSHVLTRAVGIEESVETEWKTVDARRGDVFLLCSDGVYDMVPDATLRRLMRQGGGPEAVAERIEAKVLSAGAIDNYTMVVARI